MMADNTLFAPAERASDEELHAGHDALSNAANIREILNALTEFVGIINVQRQFLLANQALLDSFGMGKITEVLGKRPGEAIRCVHSDDNNGGCGCAENCRYCGAAMAILECQEANRRVTRECRIIADLGNESAFLDLRVTATPFIVDENRYIILGISDISHEKRKLALERIFFHDVMNTATIIHVLVDYLQSCDDDDEIKEELGNLDRISKKLLEEIASHRDLTLAENGDLTVELSDVDVHELLEEAAAGLARHRVAEGKSIRVESPSVRVTVMSDRRLIRRTIVNMLKNALEASPVGTGVSAGVKSYGDSRVGVWVHNSTTMGEEEKHQVFQRSFSTRGANRGLGTYSMKLLSESYLKGTITFDSDEANGTTFIAEFPSLLP
jgi:signal transduction histidine kinase